ncbi:MAG: ankyrin repeat domain-containing protein [Candidatus Rhabdochlamydia sp.]
MTSIPSVKSQNPPPILTWSQDYFSIIQNPLDEGHTQEAIDNLLLVLNNPQDIPDLEKAYRYVFHLLPHMNQNDVGMLIPLVQNLCQYATHCVKEQALLALHLADWYVCLASNNQLQLSERFSSYLKAMDYFAKAIQISSSHDYHRRASELLMKLMQILALHPEYGFLNRLDHARRSNHIEKFGEIISGLNALESLCWGEIGATLIKQLYKEAVSLMIKIPEASKQKLLLHYTAVQEGTQRAQQNLLLKVVPQEYLTQKYFRALQAFRNVFDQLLREDAISREQITQAVKSLVGVFFRDAFTILGTPPCHYDIRAMGSCGREELCRFSDLEVLILIEKENYIEYFKLLLELLDLQIRSLGETAASHLQIIFSCIHLKNPSGFHLDSGDNCILTPTALANLQRIPNDDPATFAHMALFSISLSQNTDELFNQYRHALNKIFKETLEEGVTLGQAQALRFIKARVDDYNKFQKSPIWGVKDLKKNYTQSLNLLLADIALYWDIPDSNTEDIIEALNELKVFTPESCELLKEFSHAIYKIRLKLHSHYQEQKEEGYLTGISTQTKYVLSHEEKHLLERCDCLVLKPLYALLTPLFKNYSLCQQNQDFAKTFSQVDLVKTALENLLLADTHSGADLKKLSKHINNTDLIHVLIKSLLKEKKFFTLKLYEELGLSVQQAVDVIYYARDCSKSTFLVCHQKIVELTLENVQSALLEAISANSLFCTQVLIPLGARINPLTVTEEIPLHHAIREEASNVIFFLISQVANVNIMNHSRGSTAMHLSAQRGRVDDLKLLLERGANIEATDLDKKTPLYVAVIAGQESAVDFLFKQGADIGIRDSEGKGLLHIAIAYNHLSTVQVLLKSSQGKVLLTYQDSDGKAPLHTVFWGNEKLEILKALLETDGIDVNIVNAHGYTPLHWACKHNHLEGISLLIEKGADPTILNHYGYTPFDLALQHGKYSAAHRLLGTDYEQIVKTLSSSDDVSKRLQEAIDQGQTLHQIIYLEKLGNSHLERKEYLKASTCFNQALVLSELAGYNALYQQCFSYKLEQVEMYFLESLNKKMPGSYRNFVSNYRKQLKSIRESIALHFQENLFPTSFYQESSKLLQGFLKAVVEDCIQLLGTPPVPYAIMGLGAYSTEILPYSEFKLTFLVGEQTPESTTYFESLKKLIALKITGLGESGQSIVNHVSSTQGFRVSYITPPSLNIEGITPLQLASWQSEVHDHPLKDQALYGYLITGHLEVFNLYCKEVQSILEKRDIPVIGTSLREKRALLLMKKALAEFKLASPPSGHTLFNSRKSILNPLQSLIAALALYYDIYNIQEESSFSRIEHLQQKKVLSQETGNTIAEIIRYTQNLCCKAHLFYKTEQEKVLRQTATPLQVPTLQVLPTEFTHLTKGYEKVYQLYLTAHEFTKEKDKKLFYQMNFNPKT